MDTELFGFTAASMLTMYALEKRGRGYVLGVPVSSAAASFYAVLIRSVPFAAVEATRAIVALGRWGAQSSATTVAPASSSK